MHDMVLRKICNKFLFYTWGEPDCCLPKGSTHATLTTEKGMITNLVGPFSNNDRLKDYLMNEYGIDWIRGTT